MPSETDYSADDPSPAMPCSQEYPALCFGRYEVNCRGDGQPHELGRGGMGVTYKATDPELRRTVVLKVINPLLLGNDPQARARFRREARSAAGIHHPHIATIFDIGEERGEDYYVMEFIPGEDLLTRVKRDGPLSPLNALRVARQLVEALDAAHQQDIVHRDIKPANVMVSRRSAVREAREGPLVKIVDFGLAKALKAAGAGDNAGISFATGDGKAPYSPAYASPEQIEDEELDIRSDLYSLGVTLWHMLLGRPTFGDTSRQKTIVGHLSKEPPFGQLRAAHAPEGVIRFVGRLLEKSPADRPTVPEAALEEIDGLLAEFTNYSPPILLIPPVSPFVEEAPVSSPPKLELPVLVVEEPQSNASEAAAAELEEPESLLAPPFVAAKVVPHQAAKPGVGENASEEPAASVAEPAMTAEQAQPVTASVEKMKAAKSDSIPWAPPPVVYLLPDVLRRRGTLPVDEVLLFLKVLAPSIDAITQADASLVPDLNPANIGIWFVGIWFDASSDELDQLSILPLDQWPDFQVLRFDDASVPQMLQSSQTVLPKDDRFPASNAAQAVAALVYELLGGKPPSPERHQPLTAISEMANLVLRRSLKGTDNFRTATEFARAFENAIKSDPSPIQQYALQAEEASVSPNRQVAAHDVLEREKIPSPLSDETVRSRSEKEALATARRGTVPVALERTAKTFRLIPIGFRAGIAAFNRTTDWFAKTRDRALEWLVTMLYEAISTAFSPRWRFVVSGGMLVLALLWVYQHGTREAAVSVSINRGVAYKALGQNIEAIAEYSKAIELDPKNALANLGRSNAYLALGQLDKGIADRTKIEDQGFTTSPFDKYLFFLGDDTYDVLNDIGRSDKTLMSYSKAIALDPNNARAYFGRANAYNALGQNAKAAADYSKAIELDPNNALAYLGRAIAYKGTFQKDNAVADCSKAIELDPKDSRAYVGRGNAYVELDQNDKALADYAKAVELNPDDANVYSNRALLYDKTARPDLAKQDRDKATALAKKSP